MSESVERIYPDLLPEDDPDRVLHEARYRWAADLLAQEPPRAVVDVGCGCGYGTAILSAVCPAVGLDRDDSAVRYAREKYPNSFLRLAYITMAAEEYAERLVKAYQGRPSLEDRPSPLVQQFGQAVVAMEVLEHLAEPEALLSALRHVHCRRLLCSLPLADPPEHNPFHKHQYTVESGLNLLLNQFSVVLLSYQWGDGRIEAVEYPGGAVPEGVVVALFDCRQP